MLEEGRVVSNKTSCFSHLLPPTTTTLQGHCSQLPTPRGTQDFHPAAAGRGWAVGPNQLLISGSEGLFVVLPPPQGLGPRSTGSPDLALVVRLPGTKVWVRWGSPLSRQLLPVLFRRKPSLKSSREQGWKGEQRE